MKRRPGTANALIHFTGDRQDKGLMSAIEAYKSILKGGRLNASNKGFIKGGHKVCCFTEMPLTAVKQFMDNNSGAHRYEPYGIVIDKVTAGGWEQGR